MNSMNKEIYAVASEYNLATIELTNILIWKDSDFYDFNHMNPTGTQKLGLYLSDRIINVIDKNQ